jgi:AMP deaminase
MKPTVASVLIVKSLLLHSCFLLLGPETPSSDDVEVYKVIQKCLELRERYMFREEVAPWEKEIITDPSTPKPNPNPFHYECQAKIEVSTIILIYAYSPESDLTKLSFFLFHLFFQHHFEMVDGVVHVYPGKDCE